MTLTTVLASIGILVALLSLANLVQHAFNGNYIYNPKLDSFMNWLYLIFLFGFIIAIWFQF